MDGIGARGNGHAGQYKISGCNMGHVGCVPGIFTIQFVEQSIPVERLHYRRKRVTSNETSGAIVQAGENRGRGIRIVGQRYMKSLA